MKVEFEKQFGKGVDPWYAKAERWAKKQRFPISHLALGLRCEDHIYLMKEHFYQALNETEHLEEMELREGNKYWVDRFFAKHLVLLYYWIMVGYYLLNPVNAYDINMKIEKHAYETYVKYSAYHPEDTKIAEIAQDELDHSRELRKAMLMIA